ncbi:MAG: DinB family protein [Saprospiraceae bacterium]|nr:DinB family protein [Saprospiraceae bacterium]
MMYAPGATLIQLIEQWEPLLRQVSSQQAATAPAPGKWAPVEIVGHLIDSASNNHGRFLRAQQSDALLGLPYDQDFWVERQQYRQADWTELVGLWAGFNRLIARLMDATPEKALLQQREQHNLDQIAFRPLPAGQPATLLYFMLDYVAHLEHHLRQIV